MFQQDQDAAAGVAHIAFLLVRYLPLPQTVSSPDIAATHHQLAAALATKTVDLYKLVYLYLIRFNLQFLRGSTHRILRDAVTADEWKSMLGQIKDTSLEIDQALQGWTNNKVLETWKTTQDIITKTDDLEHLQRETLSAVHVRINIWAEIFESPRHNELTSPRITITPNCCFHFPLWEAQRLTPAMSGSPPESASQELSAMS